LINLICRLSTIVTAFAADSQVGLVLFGWTRARDKQYGQEWAKQSNWTHCVNRRSLLREQRKKYTCNDNGFFGLSQCLYQHIRVPEPADSTSEINLTIASGTRCQGRYFNKIEVHDYTAIPTFQIDPPTGSE
jgi:hypothetical protein